VFVQKKADEETLVGEFELDIAPYFLESGTYRLKFKLEDREQNKQPHYMTSWFKPKTRGSIDFKLRIQSNIKKYLLDQSPEGVSHYYQARKSVRVGGPRGSVRNSLTYRPSLLAAETKRPNAVYHARLSRIPDTIRVQTNVNHNNNNNNNNSSATMPRSKSSQIKNK
jgi:hypothetical protein